MRATRESRFRLRLASSSFVILLLAVVALVLWLSRDYHLQFDWTRNSRNTLSEASRNLLPTLTQPVRVTAFATEQGGLRKNITTFIARYQQYKPDVILTFVDPTLDPARAREANVRIDGELVVEVGQRKEALGQLTEEAFTNLLQRLGRGGERWVVFVSGHGERSPDRQANFDVSNWATQLAKRGLKTRAIALGGKTVIPENTSVLVIAGPRVKFLAAEVKQIEHYLARGGNLLWLTEPGSLHGLERVAESLGVELQRGVIVDPASQAATGTLPTFIVGNPDYYGTHPVVQGFGLTTLFPEAAALNAQAPKGWELQTILDTQPTAWSETGALDGRIQFNAGEDVRGPLNLGVSLTRKQENREQRVAVIGDGDFLSNAYLGNGGNLDLGMNLVNWLGSDDAYINVPVRTASDLSLNFSQAASIAIGLTFPVLLPLGLFGSGMLLWWRRRKR